MEITPKRVKTKEDEDEDRISELQDCLLIDIISRLESTKEAIRTGTLSKRWRHLWPYVHNLSFTNRNCYQIDDPFPSFFDNTLAQCRHSNLNKFHLCYPYNRRIVNWIRYAITRNVRELHLTLGTMKNEIKLDQSFFINSCFTHLSLKGCKFNPAGEISWRNLKSFYIFEANLDEGLIQNILSGSPMLETLVLDWCYGFRRVDITSKSVKKFMLFGFRGDTNHVIEINAPYLVSLTIEDPMGLSRILLLNVTSLEKAELYYGNRGYNETMRKEAEEEMLKGLLLSLSHVKELKIGVSFRKALYRLEAKGFILPSDMKYPDFIPPFFWKCV